MDVGLIILFVKKKKGGDKETTLIIYVNNIIVANRERVEVKCLGIELARSRKGNVFSQDKCTFLSFKRDEN